MPVLTAENIAISFNGRPVLGGVSLRSEKGKITGLLGRNGCGKSTLLKIIFGVQHAVDAIIQLNGKTIRNAYTKKDVINYAPQFPIFPKNFKISRALSCFGVQERKVYADFPSLEVEGGKTFAELSGGMERLWTVLILLYTETQFTMLDEPFSHIMPLHVETLKTVLQREKQNKGIIITDHMYRHVTEISDTMYLIKDGRTLIVNSKEDLIFHGYVPNC